MQNQQLKDNEKYKDTPLQRWVFRILSVIFICFFCFVVIRIEFKLLKNNEGSRIAAQRMLEEIKISTENLNDAWKTMYYFYQTGDLMNIIKCPNVSTGSSNDQEKKDTLLMIYREDVNTRESLLKKNIFEEFREHKNIKCGGNITINIGNKSEVYKHPNDFQTYTFKVGEEPIELLKQYPFLKVALTKIKEGERATFISIMNDRNILFPSKKIIYEIEIPESVTNETINIPFYSKINENNKNFAVNNQAYCGAVVNYIYNIYDVYGKRIKTSDIEKIKIGSGELNIIIENLMTKMKIGDNFMIFLTREMIKTNKVFTKKILDKNDILFFNLKLVNIQK